MANTKPIRVGIVGLGRAGWNMHCRELEGREKKFQIVAGCDPIQERRELLAKKYGAKTYRTVEELISDPDVEMVDIANRQEDHVSDALKALKAGKYVFLEKPIAVSYQEALKLKAARNKRKLFIRHNRRFEPAFQHIREIIASGLLGDVFEIKLRRNGFQRRDDWQTLKKCSGGQLLNWGPHLVDHGLQFLESPLAELWSNLKCVAAAGDAEDHLKIILVGKTGRLVDIEISGGAVLSEPVYIVLGSKGALTSDDASIHLKYLDPKKKLAPRKADPGTPAVNSFGSKDDLRWIEKDIKVDPKAGCRMDHIWDHLHTAIREKKAFPITLDQSLEVMRVISQVKQGTPFDGKSKRKTKKK
ncbi:MAG: Gfo/Idh/MocA family oxidoreductase [Phycisphaerae bacterium]|nr:Gfo/Idh/MocA family oxidoreductase [Phycisphaerae bacterium]